MKLMFAASVIISMLSANNYAYAENEYGGAMRSALAEKVRPWLSDAIVVGAISEQNGKTAALSEADINRLDKQWRAEAKQNGGPMITPAMETALSRFLKDKMASSNGLITELFVMDAKGLNVGQASITTDYMQGDEAKWQKTYLVGPDAVFIDEVDFDESSGRFQAQISTTISDPTTGKPIGALTIGFDVEKL